MKRVMIIGCGGAGKSTLARQLGEETGLPVVHLDKLFWHPGWRESTREEIDEKIMQAMTQPTWIIDGNYNRTVAMRLEKCDTVIYLDFHRVTCILGVAKRVITNYGKVRSDMTDGCPERFDWEFIKWVWRFNDKHRARYYTMLSGLQGKKVIILKNRREVKRFLENL